MPAFRTAVISLRGMGLGHARSAASLPDDFTVVAGADLSGDLVRDFEKQWPGAKGYTDAMAMLATEKPEVVIVATPNSSHAPLTLAALEHGARGVVVEKPMATSLAEGRAMVAACNQRGAKMIVNHQRRTWPVFRTMKRLMDSRAIGKVELVRVGCAGDVLSDGTHLIDTLRFLVDAEVRSVVAALVREPATPEVGRRYGHVVESGMTAIMEFENGVRGELNCGVLQPRGRQYQDYEVFGNEGRLWRQSDYSPLPLLIQDTRGGWRQQPIDPDFAEAPAAHPFRLIYADFAKMIRENGGHPMGMNSALRDLEVIMAMYESARLGRRVTLPLQQERFPLELMIEEGRA